MSSPHEQPVSSRTRRMAGGLAKVFFWLVVLGSVIRLSIGDSYLITALIYYVTPPAGMVLLTAFAALLLPRASVVLRRLAVIVLLVAVVWTGLTQWILDREHVAEKKGESHRIMFWNVCEGQLGWPAVFNTIYQQQADVIALAESETLKDCSEDFFTTHFSGYQRISFPRRLTVLTRFPILNHRQIILDSNGVYETVELKTKSGHLTLLFVDIPSTLTLHRKEPVKILTETANSLPGPVIIVGDFNTPVDSVFFQDLRSSFVSAFEVSGHGLHTTWPMPIPVLAIDHMWGNNNVKFLDTQILWTLSSDHRPIVSDFVVNP